MNLEVAYMMRTTSQLAAFTAVTGRPPFDTKLVDYWAREGYNAAPHNSATMSLQETFPSLCNLSAASEEGNRCLIRTDYVVLDQDIDTLAESRQRNTGTERIEWGTWGICTR